uniref:Uncharacterized protein n=1 Tax=Eutreptiella gymnastica TaxID=73025 RepID=A0A7S4C803_9EUGL
MPLLQDSPIGTGFVTVRLQELVPRARLLVGNTVPSVEPQPPTAHYHQPPSANHRHPRRVPNGVPLTTQHRHGPTLRNGHTTPSHAVCHAPFAQASASPSAPSVSASRSSPALSDA